ncbi:glutathione S-transferase family protein [Wenzhouxiangella sp. XN79A]|uniref:glutathione S-transferase family protein n=1 Tax=Wenzhouxiangella sp. XN79A TaxID=2724193 RepID=UPI00144AC1BD|nr:glutathione S-transferase family protein [Wenzhouxiangella sp. XN79A]NKI33747.1 glutathione S-transferase family protein [Wenzhouxiangella sp. XN79A]
MKLHGSYTSPYVRHCRIAMRDAGLAFEFIETDNGQSARQSPTQRVPFLDIDGLRLTDSTSILRWVREHQGRPFLADPGAFDRYLMVNTAMDAAVNLFLLERDGLRPEDVPYLARQRDRVRTILEALDLRFQAVGLDGDDGLRLACFLSWAMFRDRADPTGYGTLGGVLEHWDARPEFAATHPGLPGR